VQAGKRRGTGFAGLLALPLEGEAQSDSGVGHAFARLTRKSTMWLRSG